MTVNHQRPVNLDLATLKFPPMAIVSILHRISGMALFLLLPIMMFFLSQSLQSQESFTALQIQLMSPYCKGLLWVFSTALVYHILAGFRHMFMDIGLGEQLVTARRSAITIIALAVILTLCLGVWIW